MAGKNEAQALFDEAPDHEAQSLFDAAPEHVEAPPAQAATPPADPNSLDQKIRSGLQGATFGFGDNAVRAVNKLLPDSWNHPVAEIIDRGLHPKEYMKPLPPPLTDAETAKMYKDAVADNPGSNFAGAVMAPNIPGLKGKGALKFLANASMQGGASGFAQGVGDSEEESLAGKAWDGLKTGAVSAVASPIISGMLKGIPAAAKWGAGKFTSLKDKLLADEAARIAKPMDDAVQELTSKTESRVDQKTRGLLKENESAREAAQAANDKAAQADDLLPFRKRALTEHQGRVSEAEKLAEKASQPEDLTPFRKKALGEATKTANKVDSSEAKLVKDRILAKDKIKKKVYDEYVAAIKKTGSSPEDAQKILSANEDQIQAQIEDEYRKSLFGDYASKKKDLFTKVRNAEQLGAEWTPDQVEKTVGPAKAQYIQDASVTVDKGLPVPPEKMGPEQLKAEVLRRGKAAQAKGLKAAERPLPQLDPAVLEDLAAKRMAAMEGSGLRFPQPTGAKGIPPTPQSVEARALQMRDEAGAMGLLPKSPVPPTPVPEMTPEALNQRAKDLYAEALAMGTAKPRPPPPAVPAALGLDEAKAGAQKFVSENPQVLGGMSDARLPALYPMQSADASLTAKGKEAAGNLALKAGGSTALGAVGLGTQGPIGGVIGMGLGLNGLGAGADLNNPGLQYLMAKGGGKLLDSVPARVGRGVLSGGAELVPAAIRTRADAKTYDKLRELMKTFGAPAEDVK